MPKLKTKKAVKKRYKKIANNQFIRRKAFKGHLLEKKSSRQKRNLVNNVLVKNADSKVIRKILIY